MSAQPYCKNCKSKLHGNFCSECGHPKTLERIDRKHIVEDIGNLINLRKGFLYTVKELIIRPGEAIRQFISENRTKLVKPITFVIFCMLISITIYNLIADEVTWDNIEIVNGQSSSYKFVFYEVGNKVMTILSGHLNLLPLVSGFFMAFTLTFLFKNHTYNFYELLTLSYYVLGVYTLIDSILFIFEWILGEVYYIEYLFEAIELSYIGWAVGQFFDNHKKLDYLKGPLAFILSILITLLSIIFIIMIYAAMVLLIKNI